MIILQEQYAKKCQTGEIKSMQGFSNKERWCKKAGCQ